MGSGSTNSSGEGGEIGSVLSARSSISGVLGGEQSPPAPHIHHHHHPDFSRTSAGGVATTAVTTKARPFLISNIMGLEETRRLDGGGSPGHSPPSSLPGIGGCEEDGVGGGGVDSPGHSPSPDSDSELAGDEDSLAKVTVFRFVFWHIQ